MSTELEQHQGAALAVRTDQTDWTPLQKAALAHMGVGDAPDADQRVFLHHCQRTGLDPFAKQVYMIGRSGDVTRIDDQGRKITERGTIYTIQTGVDGYRLIGNRAAARAGDTLEHEPPQWCDDDGEWFDFWPKSKGAPAAARYVIRKNGQAVTAVCNYDEYAQYSGKGNLTPMWSKMPANQLAVRAECQAWRKAYPADFSGVGVEGDPYHHTVIDGETGEVLGEERSPRRGPRGGVAALEQHLEQQPAAAPSDQRDDKSTVQESTPVGTISNAQLEAVVKGLSVLFPGNDTGDARRDYVIRNIGGRVVGNLRELDTDEADELLVTIAADTAREAEANTKL